MRVRGRALAAAAAVLLIAASWLLPAAWIETLYARGLYPWINAVLVPCSSAVALPLTLALLVLAPPLLALLAIRRWRARGRRGETRRRRFAALARAGAECALLAYAAFLLLWGTGYRRPPIEQRLGFAGGALERADTEAFLERLLARIRSDLPGDGTPPTADALAACCAALQQWVAAHDGWTPALPQQPKTLPAGLLLTFGVSGVISPFLLEAHVDGGLPEAARVGIGAHELAHVAGLCGEADADLVSYLACAKAEHPFARYAIALRIFDDLSAELPADLRKRASETLPARARRDLAAVSAAYARYRVRALAEVSWTIYDSYLQAHGVEAGIGDYSRGVRLLLQAWRRGLVDL
jgi:hypothetical protein